MTVQVERLPRESLLVVHPLLRRQPAVATTLLLTLCVAGWGAARTGVRTPPPAGTLVASAAPLVSPGVERAVANEKPATAPAGAPHAAAAMVRAVSIPAEGKVTPTIAVPPNPFLPTEPDPLPEPPKLAAGALPSAEGVAGAEVSGLPVGEGGIPSLPPVGPLANLLGPLGVSGTAPAIQAVPNRTPAPPEIIGIVQGEPPLVVVKSEGQSFYLKIGDQVADTWRLEAIKERSAIFRLGGRRVEIPIQGGNS